MFHPISKAPLRATLLVSHTSAFSACFPDALSDLLRRQSRLFATHLACWNLCAQVFCCTVRVKLHLQRGA